MAFLAFLLFWSWAGAKDTVFRIESQVNKTEVYIGDEIEYRLSVYFSPEVKIEKPGPGLDFGKFEIKNFSIIPLQQKNGIFCDVMIYTNVIFETGEHTIPQVTVRGLISNEWKILKTPEIKITVREILLSGATNDLADLKKQASVRGRWSVRFLIFCIIAVSLTAAGIIFFIYYRYKKAGKREIPYYEQALQDLEKLCRKKFFSSGKYREFYYEFSTIVKHFLDGKTGRLFSVLMTTEIKDLLPLLLPGDAAVFSGFFSYADRVKFALFIPEKNTTREYLEFFIRQFSAERLSAEPVKNEGPLPEEPVPAPVLPALPEEI